MLETILGFLLKGSITRIGSEGVKTLYDKIKIYFEKPIDEKILKAYSDASTKYTNGEIVVGLEGDEYYKHLLYSFNIIDGSELSSYEIEMSKLFLSELFRIPELGLLVLSTKIDNVHKELIQHGCHLKNIENYFTDIHNSICSIKNHIEDKCLEAFPINHFISKLDFEDLPQYYIPRKLNIPTDWYTEISSFEQLVVLNNEKQDKPIRALILADGGVGKSTFFKYWAGDIDNLNGLYPVFVSLRDCKSEDILFDYVKRRHINLGKVKDSDFKNLCFFLDGFDEIGNSTNAIKQINDFCRCYPKTHILLSSRRNSYYGQFPYFIVLSLSEISLIDIEVYIAKAHSSAKIDVKHFFEEVNRNNFKNLISNPFYLESLITSYI